MSSAGRPGDGACPLCQSREFRLLLRFADARFGAEPLRLGRCGGCGLVRLDPCRTPAQDAAYYAGRSAAELHVPLDRALFDREYARQAHALDETVRTVAVRPGLRVLDVGCGNGFLLWRLAQLGCRVRGVELDAGLAAFDHGVLGLAVTHGSVEALGAGEVFDCATLTDVIEHLPDPLALLAAVRERLAPGGTLVVKAPNWNVGRRHLWLARLRGGLAPNLTIQGEHLTYFTPATLRRLLAAAGFAGVRVGPARSTYLARPRNHAVGQWLAALSRALPERWNCAPCLLATAHRTR